MKPNRAFEVANSGAKTEAQRVQAIKALKLFARQAPEAAEIAQEAWRKLARRLP
jgi:hypothetical protein